MGNQQSQKENETNKQVEEHSGVNVNYLFDLNKKWREENKNYFPDPLEAMHLSLNWSKYCKLMVNGWLRTCLPNYMKRYTCPDYICDIISKYSAALPQFKINDVVDIQDQKNRWYPSRIVDVRLPGEELNERTTLPDLICEHRKDEHFDYRQQTI